MRRAIAVTTALAALGVTMAAGAVPASAAGGNSANAKLCQKGGWENLVRSDNSAFTDQSTCVSYAAQGGTLAPKPPCTAGTENFSDDAHHSSPTTFAGGTLQPGGEIRVQGQSWFGSNQFPAGGHLLWTLSDDFTLTFTAAVSAVQLDSESLAAVGEPVTLTAYDASGAVVGTPDTAGGRGVHTLSVSSTTNNIATVTLTTTPGWSEGFSNLVWSCAA